jgi:hypothetical protein
MKHVTTTAREAQARRHQSCYLTCDKRKCGIARVVTISGLTIRLCAVHRKLLRQIVKDANKPLHYERHAA